ncbi:unnamed protein product [Cylicostephanus goldi]|uniref:Uncharacterized protein n=1 Tax=Cylicostephanus goldi TaxID=71465 RepID=A0A3P6RWC2_CYLGO|nr:unnamed protein product [Cylicostephanus goldi]
MHQLNRNTTQIKFLPDLFQPNLLPVNYIYYRNKFWDRHPDPNYCHRFAYQPLCPPPS